MEECGICYEEFRHEPIDDTPQMYPSLERRFTCIQCLKHVCEDCLYRLELPFKCPYCRKIDYRIELGYYSALSEKVLNELSRISFS
jgi:hypothetical protein